MVNVHANVITKELGSYLRKHVAACLRLLDDGATVPFISRYRKEATGEWTRLRFTILKNVTRLSLR